MKRKPLSARTPQVARVSYWGGEINYQLWLCHRSVTVDLTMDEARHLYAQLRGEFG